MQHIKEYKHCLSSTYVLFFFSCPIRTMFFLPRIYCCLHPFFNKRLPLSVPALSQLSSLFPGAIGYVRWLYSERANPALQP